MGKEVSEVTEKKNIFESIQAVMGEIGAVGKTSKNAQQGFMYRGIDAVMNALQPALIKHGVFVVPEILEQTREERVNAKGTTLIYSICKIKYNFYAQDGSSVSAIVIGEGMDTGDKATNKAMSIAFKYACFQVFCIPTEEMVDPDAEVHEVKAKTEKKAEPKQEQKNLKATPKQIELLKKLVPDEAWGAMLNWAGVEKVEDMTAAQASEVITNKSKKEA
jgi:hypothetical protein